MKLRDTGFRIQDSGEAAEGFSVSRIPNPESSRGFTLLELIIVVSIVAILAGALLSRVAFYQEQAEKAAMEQAIGAIQSSLVMRYGALVTRGAANDKEIRALAAANPIELLQQKPRNYAGEYFDPSPQTIRPGSWYYDLKAHELVYMPDHTAYFTADKHGKNQIRFHTRFVYEPVAGRGKAGKEVVATLFEPVEPYHWME